MIYKDKHIEVQLNGRTFHCALDITMAFLGGKWKAVVLWYLREAPLRFSQLRRLMPEITEKMLSLQLKHLEKDGLVSRKVFAEVPPRVEYALTKEGRSLAPALEALAAWGRRKGKREGRLVVSPPRSRGRTKQASPAAAVRVS
jgi:DNA-binding HxlR family transcriptional regulator